MSGTDVDLSETNGGSLVVTAAIFLTLSWISVSLRTYTRLFLTSNFQVDDWFMLVSLAIFTASCAFILVGVKAGIGRHNAAITDEQSEVDALMWQSLATATYIIDMMFIKLSIGIFLLRLSVQRVYRMIILVSLVIITIWSTASFLWNLFQCNPVQKQWDFRIDSGHCVSATEVVAAAYALSVMTILSDWLYALLPIPMLWKVKMTSQAKVTVIVILGLGIFASIATLIRLRFLADLENIDDILYAGTDAMVWTLVEPGVAIVASSLATIRPLLRAMRISGFESQPDTYGTGRSSGSRSAYNYLQQYKAKRASAALPAHYGPRDPITEDDIENEGGTTIEMDSKNPFSSAREVGDSTVGELTDTNYTSHRVSIKKPGGPVASDSLSEVYVIEGNRSASLTSAWSEHHMRAGSSSGTPSVEQLHSQPPQRQSTGDEVSR